MDGDIVASDSRATCASGRRQTGLIGYRSTGVCGIGHTGTMVTEQCARGNLYALAHDGDHRARRIGGINISAHQWMDM